MYDRNKIIKKVSIIGVITNLILMSLKLFGGIFSRSSALIADSLHSAEDMLASILSWVSVLLEEKNLLYKTAFKVQSIDFKVQKLHFEIDYIYI